MTYFVLHVKSGGQLCLNTEVWKARKRMGIKKIKKKETVPFLANICACYSTCYNFDMNFIPTQIVSTLLG